MQVIHVELIHVAAFIGTIIAATWAIIRHTDFMMKELKQEIKEDFLRSENRWAALFEKFHILDKDVEKFRLKYEKKKEK